MDIIFREIIYKNIKRNTYFINEDGDIYTRNGNKILIPKSDKNGYLCVRLAITDDGKYNKEFYIAHLVMNAFGTLPPSDMKEPTIDHIDNNKINNNIYNLQWLEHDDNCAKINAKHKLTEEQVHNICKYLETGINCRQISLKFNVTPMTIHKIKNRETWKHISKDYRF